MTTILFVVIAIAVVVVIIIARRGSRTFDDPKAMSNLHLLSCIAGQADSLEKIARAPFGSQIAPSVVEIRRKRKAYMAQLCAEVVSRAVSTEGQLGATAETNAFSETAEYAKNLQATGVSAEKSNVRAIKEKLFAANGIVYPSSWEE